MVFTRSLTACFLVLLITQSTLGEKFQSIDIEPATIEITGGNRQIQILITGRRVDQPPVDLTHQAKITIVDNQVATLSESLVLGLREG